MFRFILYRLWWLGRRPRIVSKHIGRYVRVQMDHNVIDGIVVAVYGPNNFLFYAIDSIAHGNLHCDPSRHYPTHLGYFVARERGLPHRRCR
jgi:hypothetical protein